MINDILNYSAIIFLIIFGLFLIGTLFMLIGIRSAIDEEIPNSNISGERIGGVFLMQLPTSIDLNTKKSELKKLEKQHNKFVNYFWMNFINLVIAIILLNIAE